MNEPMAGAPDPSTPGGAFDKSAGTLLREAREAVGLHVGSLAVSLKVPVKKLEALEADDLEQLPDAVFARALAATVCRTLKIDPGPVLARLPQIHTAPLQVGSQETPIRLDNRGAGLRMPGFGGLPRWVLYLTALLLLGAIVVSMLPSWRIIGDATLADAQPGTTADPVVSTPAAPVEEVATGAVTTAATDAAPAAMLSASTAAASEALAAPEPAASDAANASANATPGAADSPAIAVFTTREPSWLQVTDAAGVVHVSKTMAGGETVRVQGSLPLSVVIGRVNAIDVVVRGEPFDLAAVSKNNVARFQIK